MLKHLTKLFEKKPIKPQPAVAVKPPINHKFLLHASEQGDLNVVKQMITSGTHIEIEDKDGNTPLILASREGHLEVVKFLLEKGASLEAKNHRDNTALNLASWNGHLEVVKLLLAHDVELEHRNMHGYTPLMQAAHNGHLEIVQLLLEKGANKEAKDNDGSTVLHFAADSGKIEVAKFLLAKGAHIDARCASNHTPLIYAAFQGQLEMVKLLLVHGANLEIQNDAGHTALSLAKIYNRTSVVNYLQNFKRRIVEKEKSFEARLEKIHFEGNVPPHFLCPITQSIMNDPVTLANGQTYDHDALKGYFRSRNFPDTIPCPLTKEPITIDALQVKTSIIIKNLIEAFVISEEEKFNKLAVPTVPNSQDESTIKEGKMEVNEKIITVNKEEIRNKRLLYFNNLFNHQASAHHSAPNALIMENEESLRWDFSNN